MINSRLIAQQYEEFESKGETINGLKEGKWVDVNKHGVTYKEYSYKKGKPTGIWKRFRPDGQIRNQTEISDDKIITFIIYKPYLSYIAIHCDSGFSQKQYLKLLDFEEQLIKDELIKNDLRDKGVKLTPMFEDEWKETLKSIMYSMNINAIVSLNSSDGLVQSMMTFDRNKGLSQIDYFYDKHKQVKREDIYEYGKKVKSMYFKNGAKIKEELLSK
jgi:hypothetical protein